MLGLSFAWQYSKEWNSTEKERARRRRELGGGGG